MQPLFCGIIIAILFTISAWRQFRRAIFTAHIIPPTFGEAAQSRAQARLLHYGKTDMKNTIAYIDGGNLYYGQLRRTGNKWLDIEAFCRKLLRPDHDITAIKGTTANFVELQVA